MPLVSPSFTVLGVFLATTWSLFFSVSRDLSSAPELQAWRQRLASVASSPFHGTPDDHEAISRDLHIALSVIQRSELTVYLIVQWCISAYTVVAMLTVAIFLGQLSSREVSRLSERLLKFVVFKVVFCGALIIPDIYEIVLWLAWFAMVGYMRIFMGAAKDRLESLVVSPRATTLAHVRALALVVVILVHDVAGMAALLSSVNSMSITKALLCAFDMAIVLVEGIKTLLRYAVHIWDQRVASQDHPGSPQPPSGSSGGFGWESWEGKGALLYHTELVADVLVHAMTLAHYLHVWFLHGLSFQLIDAILFLDIRSIILSMLKRIRGYLNYRHATHSLRHAFPDAMLGSSHELCSICMERMSCAKQLPCQHHFHLACLRAWLQQSGTESFACPLCRTPLLRAEAAAEAATAQQARRQQQRGTGHHHAAAAAARPRGLLRRLLSAVSRLVSALYLDLIFGLLLGLPSSTAALQRHALAAAAVHREREREAAASGAGAGARSGRRSGTRHQADEPPVERVGENDHPSPAAAGRARARTAAAAAARSPLRAWLGALVPGVLRRRFGAGTQGGVAVQAAGVHGDALYEVDEEEEEGQEEQSYSIGSADEDAYTSDDDDMHDIAAEDDSFQAPSQLLRRSQRLWAPSSDNHHQHHLRQAMAAGRAVSPVVPASAAAQLGEAEAAAGVATGLDEGVGPRALSGRGHALLGEAPLRGLAGAEGVAAAAGGEGDEDEDADVLGQLPPLLPPPYPEPSSWSGGSLHALGQQVAHTIRTSWGMGAHGPGAVAGQEHGTDQEAQSGRRLRPRQRSRPSPAASPIPPSAEPHRWADLDAEGAAAFGGEAGAAAGTGERRPGTRRRRHLQAELDGEAGAGDAGLPRGGRPRRSGSAPSQ